MRQAPTLVRLLVLLAVSVVVSSGCDMLPSLPGNPFRSTPTAVPVPSATPPPPSPTVVPTATPVPFQAYWVKNFKPTEMWSGQPNQPGVVSFGTTTAQFCSFQVVRQQDGPRLYVLNPYSKDYLFIDADAVGPVPHPPARASGPKPPDQNCAEEIYD
jgi:hypothetical protein